MTKLIATICYYLQLHKVAYWLNRNRKRTITFHNILTDDVFENNVANGVSNSLSQFKAIIDEIARHFDFSLDLDDSKTVTITFDDGYRNQVEIAAPYLRSKGVPAYLFVSGRLLPSDGSDGEQGVDARPLTIDLLLHWVGYVPNGKYSIKIGGVQTKIELTADNRLRVWVDTIWPAFMSDGESKGENLMNALDAAYPIQKMLASLPKLYIKQRLEGASVEQFEELAQQGWQIGWHTYSHYPLAKLSHEQKVYELTPDKRIKSKVLSFPYGGPTEVDSICLEIAKNLGYATAVSNVNVQNFMTGDWFRSRMALPADRIMLHFELSGLKHMIKYRKLLPKI